MIPNDELASLRPPLLRHALRRGAGSDADDVVSEALVKIWLTAEFRGAKQLLAYGRRVVDTGTAGVYRRRAIDALDRQVLEDLNPC